MATSATVMSPAAQPLPYDLLLELLIRLPFKKVNQFRCVSKEWSTIISRPFFSKAYNARHCSTGIVYFVQATRAGILYFARAADGDIHGHTDNHKFHWSAHRVEEPQEPVFNLRFDDFSGICSQVVNGLVCFQSYRHVYVGNVVTGEKKKLPHLGRSSMDTVKLLLGFDPVNRVYKLLRIFSLRRSTIFPWFELYSNWYASAQILTIGDSSWRELTYGISELSYLNPASPSILLDGVLYSGGRYNYNVDEDTIIAFDLSEEKFRLVHPPLWYDNQRGLAQFRGKLSVIAGAYCDREDVIIYSLEDDLGHSWSTYKTILPEELQYSRNGFRILFSVGNLQTGEILLLNQDITTEYRSKGYHTPVYSFDHKNNKFVRFMLPELAGSVFYELPCSVKLKFETLDDLLHNPSGI